METITRNVFMIYCHDQPDIVTGNTSVSPAPGLPLSARPAHEVRSYRELLKKVASLSFHNSRFRLLFRGQTADHIVNWKGDPGVHSSLYPSILRPSGKADRRGVLDQRFSTLRAAEKLLMERIPDNAIHSHQIVRWALLQHYEVVPTPLLDVTHSLQTAISFALPRDADEGFLFVLAFPQLSGTISVSIESMTQVIDLSQLCPPEALRPHFQAGVLVGDYPTIDSTKASHGGKGFIANNFACRLLAKFKLCNGRSWSREGFTETSQSILFPEDDEWLPILRNIRTEVLDR